MALAPHDIEFRGKTSIKGQALADFLLMEEEYQEESIRVKVEDADYVEEEWVLMVNGSPNTLGAGIGIVLITLVLGVCP